MLRAVGTRGDGEFVFGIYGLPGGFSWPGWRRKTSRFPLASNALERSDYRRLHREILDMVFDSERSDSAVDFEYEVENVLARVDSGEAQLGIVMRSIPMPDFVDIVTRGLDCRRRRLISTRNRRRGRSSKPWRAIFEVDR